MRKNVFIYHTNGNVEKLFVECPEVGTSTNLDNVLIGNHYAVRISIDDWEEDYELVAMYRRDDVVAIYADGKCVWHNDLYIKYDVPQDVDLNNCIIYDTEKFPF